MNFANLLLNSNSNDDDSVLNSGRIYFPGLRSAYAEVFIFFIFLKLIIDLQVF